MTCLLEYRFEGVQLTQIDSDREGDMIFVGTSNGQLLTYLINVEPAKEAFLNSAIDNEL